MESFHIPQDITATQNSRRPVHQKLQGNPIQEPNIPPTEYNTPPHEPEPFSSPIRQRTEPTNPNSRTSMPNLSQSTVQPQTTLRINNPNHYICHPYCNTTAKLPTTADKRTNERTNEVSNPANRTGSNQCEHLKLPVH